MHSTQLKALSRLKENHALLLWPLAPANFLMPWMGEMPSSLNRGDDRSNNPDQIRCNTASTSTGTGGYRAGTDPPCLSCRFDHVTVQSGAGIGEIEYGSLCLQVEQDRAHLGAVSPPDRKDIP
jgi:hypothetical protein